MLIICVFAILTANILGRRISKPIRKVAEDLSLMQKGDFTGIKYKPYLKNKNETGVLAKALDSVQMNMKSTVGLVGNSSKDISGAVGQLENVIGNLVDQVSNISAISEELAASMEETAATAENLSTSSNNMVVHIDKMNDKNREGMLAVQGISERANILKVEAAKSYEETEILSKQSEGRLKAAIEESKQVEQIDQLTNAILNIADQTTLLSLNASIEAARAGEAGRGFSVVADQIRQLAEQSSTAAVETRELIEGAIREVEQGNEAAERASASIKIVVEGIGKIASSSKMVSSTSADQATAMKQAEQGVNQISEVVQSNSATAEESSATSEELSAQAVCLDELIGKFILPSDL